MRQVTFSEDQFVSNYGFFNGEQKMISFRWQNCTFVNFFPVDRVTANICIKHGPRRMGDVREIKSRHNVGSKHLWLLFF